jgi:hypothetical protein
LNVSDVEYDLNYPRPILAGGTGASNAHDAMVALGGEISHQLVDNYDTYPFRTGSFYSNPGATSGPPTSVPVAGTVILPDDNPGFCMLRAWPLNQLTTGVAYVREKNNNSWGPWATITSPNAVEAAKVNRVGDTMTGALQVNSTIGASSTITAGSDISSAGNIIAGADLRTTNGIIRFGDVAAGRYLYWTGAEYLLSGGILDAASGVKTGTVQFNPTAIITNDSNSLFYRTNGANYWQDYGGTVTNMILDGAGNLNTRGVVTGSGLAATADVSTSTLHASAYVMLGTSGGNQTLYFGNSGGIYLNYAGGNFGFTGGTALYAPKINIAYGGFTPGNDSGCVVTNGTYGGGIVMIDGGNRGKIWCQGGDVIVATGAAPGNQKMLLSDQGTSNIYGNFNVSGAHSVGSNILIGSTPGAGALYFGGGGPFFSYGSEPGINLWGARFAVLQSSIYSAGDISTATNGYKPGGGSWADSSDVRIKNVVGDYAGGLDEILALHPKRFTFKGNDTPDAPSHGPQMPGAEKDTSTPVVPYKNSAHYTAATSAREYIGLIAQEADPVMPEMISNHTGYIDGVQTEVLDLDTTPLVYALINAVKTLAARIEVLEAARK